MAWAICVWPLPFLTVLAPAERDHQEDDGSWYGRWGVNYIYGTWQVLRGLRALNLDMNQQWLLARTPPGGLPTAEDFRFVETPLPEPGANQMLSRLSRAAHAI